MPGFITALTVSSLLGFLAGLGVGGGSLLILWLTLWAGVEQEVARTINLLFFLPSALVSTLFRRKQGAVDIKKLLPAMVAGAAFGAVFSIIGQNMDTDLLKTLFGGLLVITGIRELLYRRNRES